MQLHSKSSFFLMQFFDPFHLTARKPKVTKKAQVLQKKPYNFGKYATSPQMVRESVQTLRSSGYKVFPPNELPQPYTDVVTVSTPINFNTGITQLLYGGGGTQFKDIGSYWTPEIHSIFDPLWNVENPTDFMMDIDVLNVIFTGQLNVNNPNIGNGPEIYFENSDNLISWFNTSVQCQTGLTATISFEAYDNNQLLRSWDVRQYPDSARIANSDLVTKSEFTDSVSLKRIHFEGLEQFHYVKEKLWANLGNPFFYSIYEEDIEASYLPMNFSNSYCLCTIHGVVQFQY